jgi:hypothetical protein
VEEVIMDHQAFAELLGNYGEFLGSLAVLATLLVLVFQVRGARAEFSSQMSRDLKRHNNEDIQFPLKDPRTLDVHIRAQRDFDSLEDADKIYWGVWLFSWITQTEDIWLARRRGIPEMDWAGTYLNGVALVLRSDGGKVMWPRLRGWFDPDFAAAVDEEIQNGDVQWLDAMLGRDGNAVS